MGKKELYRKENDLFLMQLAKEPGIEKLPNGVLYRVKISGDVAGKSPNLQSVVTCNYKGSLISGTVFDNSWERGCPEAFRVKDLIAGFSEALLHMHIGDRWEIFIPYSEGYGTRSVDIIPGYSTLIFDVELVGIA
jgi:peptidylprolyl isomerase